MNVCDILNVCDVINAFVPKFLKRRILFCHELHSRRRVEVLADSSRIHRHQRHHREHLRHQLGKLIGARVTSEAPSCGKPCEMNKTCLQKTTPDTFLLPKNFIPFLAVKLDMWFYYQWYFYMSQTLKLNRNNQTTN